MVYISVIFLIVIIYLNLAMINSEIVVRNLIEANHYISSHLIYPAIKVNKFDAKKHSLGIITEKFYHNQIYMTLNPKFFFRRDWRIVIKNKDEFYNLIDEILEKKDV